VFFFLTIFFKYKEVIHIIFTNQNYHFALTSVEKKMNNGKVKINFHYFQNENRRCFFPLFPETLWEETTCQLCDT